MACHELGRSVLSADEGMHSFNLQKHPHRRYNPLRRVWILVSPHRMERPWQGQVEEPPREERPPYDPQCYLCPGNERAGGVRNPAYSDTFVFDNDFPSLLPTGPEGEHSRDGLLLARSERGRCRVVCFSPRHDLSLPRMDRPAIRRVVDTWVQEYRQLGSQALINYVQIFENKGAMMGASNPHPHGQIWCNETLPLEPAREQDSLLDYRREKGSCLLCAYLALELAEQQRVVCANQHFVALVPFWAVWPFETLLLSRRHLASIDRLSADEKDGLADIIKRLTGRYDNLFRVSFPYSMGFHQKPTDGEEHPEWHLHAHFYPPLLRSATVRKFMVGYELLGNPQRDLTAEKSAECLRSLPEEIR
jgi:UDPglucose--hexose-1-phosphate uridylyltransferase